MNPNGGLDLDLRDYLAAQIANGLLAQQDIGPAAMAPHHDGNGLHHSAAQKLARIAYLVADAMLRERERVGGHSQNAKVSALAPLADSARSGELVAGRERRISEAKKRYEELCDERDALNHECAAAEDEWLELQREPEAEGSARISDSRQETPNVR